MPFSPFTGKLPVLVQSAERLDQFELLLNKLQCLRINVLIGSVDVLQGQVSCVSPAICSHATGVKTKEGKLVGSDDNAIWFTMRCPS